MRWLSLLVLFAACSSEAPAWDVVPPGKGQKLALSVNVPPMLVTAKHRDFIVKLSVAASSTYLDILHAQTGMQFQRHLWHLGKVLVNNFGSSQQGGTGLICIYHPVTKSELQFLCKVAKARGKGGA